MAPGLSGKTWFQIIATAADGVSIIRLLSPGAGMVDGLKVGDDAEVVRAKWGNPHSTEGAVALYNAGVWSVVLRLAEDMRVRDVSLGYNVSKWPDFDSDDAVIYRPE